MKKPSTAGLIVLVFIAFISLGLPDGLLGVAWPGIRGSFQLPLDAMALLLVFGTAGYMTSGLFNGVLMRRLGLGGLLALSCAATAATLAVYAFTPVWWLFVVIAALGGLGAGAIDAGINTYVARHHGERTMQWLHASFGIGITAGPMIMTLGLTVTSRWQSGYIWVACAQGLLALMFLITRGAWKNDRTDTPETNQEAKDAAVLESLASPAVLLSAIVFFLYVGVEIGLGLWVYTLLTESRGISEHIAGIVTGSYWATFTLGRILAGLYSRRIPIRTLLFCSFGSAFLGIFFIFIDAGSVLTIFGVALTGFSVAPVFPGLVSDTEERVGRRHQANAIGLQISAAGLGGALLPSLAGVFARRLGLEVIPIYMAVAVLLVSAFYMLSTLLGKPAARDEGFATPFPIPSQPRRSHWRRR